MVWWLWVLSGIVLLFLEMVTPGGLFALFFGVGAFCVAILAALRAPAIAQWLAFPLVSVVLLATLRGTLHRRLFRPAGPPVDTLVGEEVILLGDVPAGGEGRAELRGVPWRARADDAPLRAGQRCRVERIDGLVLWVRAE